MSVDADMTNDVIITDSQTQQKDDQRKQQHETTEDTEQLNHYKFTIYRDEWGDKW